MTVGEAAVPPANVAAPTTRTPTRSGMQVETRPDAAAAPADAEPRLPWWWSASLILLALALAAYRLAHTEADPDLWGHVRFGLDLLETGRVARPDTYSYLTGGIPWINHEWLSELLMALAYRGAGATGLIALKTMLGLAVAVLVARHLRRQRLSLLATLFLTAYGMVVLYPGLRPMRPQAFTYLCLTLVLLLIAHATAEVTAEVEGADGDGRASSAFATSAAPHAPVPPHASVPPAASVLPAASRSPAWTGSLWWTLPIMAAWANLHGAFVAGLGLLAIWWGSRAAAAALGLAPSVRLARDGAILAAACAATLVNPYGVDMWTFLGRTLVPRPEISEWQALPLGSLEGLTYGLVVLLGVIGCVHQPWPRRAIVLPLLVTGVALPLLARRHLPLLALIVLVLCAGDAARAIGAMVWRRWPRMQQARSQRGRPLLAAALAIEAIVILALAWPEWTRIAVDPEAYPIAATRRLADAGVPVNLAVFFDWGEYVLWHAGPRVKVSVDGRRETVYPDDVYAENMALTEGAGDWDRLLRTRPTDAALVSVHTPAAALLALHPEWEKLMDDGAAVLYGRRGAAITAALRVPGEGSASGEWGAGAAGESGASTAPAAGGDREGAATFRRRAAAATAPLDPAARPESPGRSSPAIPSPRSLARVASFP